MWIVISEGYDGTEASGPFTSKENAHRWLIQKHCLVWFDDEEFQCEDHDLTANAHTIVLVEDVV